MYLKQINHRHPSSYKVAFIDPSGWDYDIESPYQIPFGGSQSALCYLSEALAKYGWELFLVNNTKNSRQIRGVNCCNISELSENFFEGLDVAIVLNQAELGFTLRSQLLDKTLLILWTTHDVDQPAVQALKDKKVQNVYNSIVFVSNWQQQQYHQYFDLDLISTVVMRNAIAPTFAKLTEKLLSETEIISNKSKQPILFYTSTPFRGLDLLIEIFPEIRQVIPTVKLQVFSSMKVYQVQEESDFFNQLYLKCQQTEGVEYIGSLRQPELAHMLQQATILVYPNTFPETSCIAAIEAMASGCYIITSDLGALPETTSGFADLVEAPISFNNVESREFYKKLFIERTITLLRSWQNQQISNPKELEKKLRYQLNFVRDRYTWTVRVQEWITYLEKLIINHQKYIKTLRFTWEQSTKKYEDKIATYPKKLSNYIQLFILFLLQEREEEAQILLLSILSELEDKELQNFIQLVKQGVLDEKLCQEEKGNLRIVEILDCYLDIEEYVETESS